MTISVSITNNDKEGRPIRIAMVDYATHKQGMSREVGEISLTAGDTFEENVWYGRSLVVTEPKEIGKWEEMPVA